MVFCNKQLANANYVKYDVTILILIDGFLQFPKYMIPLVNDKSQSLF